eukprot:65421-Pleurochrysis_carterae.AAC.1
MKSANHSSAVAVRPTAVASITRARTAIRSLATFAAAPAEGPWSPQWSSSAPSNAPPRPMASTLAAMVLGIARLGPAPRPAPAASSGSDALHALASASPGSARRA